MIHRFQDPVLFLSLVGLLSVYISEIDKSSKISSSQFLDWLDDKGHQHLATSIRKDKDIHKALKPFLRSRRENIEATLSRFSNEIAKISRSGKLRRISISLGPDKRLSRQAQSILLQMSERKASSLLMVTSHDGPILSPNQGGGHIELYDNEFLNEDLEMMVNLGLFFHELRGGTARFSLSREGAELSDDLRVRYNEG
jgi:hypothetical protein